MTKEVDWICDRARVLCAELHNFGVRVPLDDAENVIRGVRSYITKSEGVSPVRARALVTDELLNLMAVGLADSCTAPARAALRTTTGKQLTVQAAQQTLIGLLTTILLDLDDDDTWAARDRTKLARDVASAIRDEMTTDNLVTDESVALRPREARKLYDALRDGAGRFRVNELEWDADEASRFHVFLTRAANGLLGAPDTPAESSVSAGRRQPTVDPGLGPEGRHPPRE